MVLIYRSIKYLFAITVILFASQAKAATVLTGSSDFSTGDVSFCTFACTNRMQQLYSSTFFSDPVLINKISFFADNVGVWNGSATWQLSISTSDKRVTAQDPGTFGNGGLSRSFDENVGPDEVVFDNQTFSGNVPFGQRVSFIGSFTYDPSFGDLLIDLQLVSGETTRSFGVVTRSLSQSPDATTYGLIATNTGGNNCSSDGCLQMLTEFEVSPVPIPAAAWLFASGLIGLVGLARRRR